MTHTRDQAPDTLAARENARPGGARRRVGANALTQSFTVKRYNIELAISHLAERYVYGGLTIRECEDHYRVCAYRGFMDGGVKGAVERLNCEVRLQDQAIAHRLEHRASAAAAAGMSGEGKATVRDVHGAIVAGGCAVDRFVSMGRQSRDGDAFVEARIRRVDDDAAIEWFLITRPGACMFWALGSEAAARLPADASVEDFQQAAVPFRCPSMTRGAMQAYDECEPYTALVAALSEAVGTAAAEHRRPPG